MVAAGFLILASCPGAPFGPPITAIARGNLAVSAALLILAGSSAIAAPFLLRVLLPLVLAGGSLRVDPARVSGTLVLVQLAPLGVGLAVPVQVKIERAKYGLEASNTWRDNVRRNRQHFNYGWGNLSTEPDAAEDRSRAGLSRSYLRPLHEPAEQQHR
jgi:hypothetical protein